MKAEMNTSEQRRLKRLDEASEWLLRLQSPERTDEQLNDWLRWIDADPDNFTEFEQLQRDWKDLDTLKSSASNFRRARAGVKGLRLRWRTAWALAAGVGAIAVAVAGAHYLWSSSSTAPQQLSATVKQRAATLPDGSRMVLGAQSRVDVDFNGPKRQLDLSSGEAYFKVKQDRARPFVVQAGEISVTAIGTAFDVRRDRDKITVTVEEGTVEVSSHAAGQRRVTWRAEAGYQLAYSTRRRTASIASINLATELAWRNGELAYVREPLGVVVENLNRYSTRKIVIEDPEIARLSFTGTAFASSLDDWLAGIEQAYPVSVKRTSSGDIILSARQ